MKSQHHKNNQITKKYCKISEEKNCKTHRRNDYPETKIEAKSSALHGACSHQIYK